MQADVAVVVSNKRDAFGLERARKAGIPAVHIERTDYQTFSAYNEALVSTMLDHKVDLVVMAGYMRLLGTEVLDAYPNQVMNLHPALLPSFAGAAGIKEAFDHGVKITGVTVHFANEVFDDGPIILQEPVRVEDDDTVESLEAKIHAVEHRLLPEAVKLYAEGRLSIEGRKVKIAAG